MKWSILAATAVALVAASCEPNETSFVVEHVKSLPDPPSCTYSISDSVMSSVSVDLAVASSVTNAYMVKNQLVSREDYDNLTAESNAILTEGYEVSVNLASTNENVGGSSQFIHEYLVEPQSEDLLVAFTVPPNVLDALADEYDCLPFGAGNYPESNLGVRGAADRNDNPVPRDLGMAYSTIRFFGHTQGQSDVETQDFSFMVHLCCGCSIAWANCATACDRYCESPDDIKSCSPGVGSGSVDCRYAYNNPLATWPGDCLDEEDNPVACDCESCGR